MVFFWGPVVNSVVKIPIKYYVGLLTLAIVKSNFRSPEYSPVQQSN